MNDFKSLDFIAIVPEGNKWIAHVHWHNGSHWSNWYTARSLKGMVDYCVNVMHIPFEKLERTGTTTHKQRLSLNVAMDAVRAS